MDEFTPWSHQTRSASEVLRLHYEENVSRICLTSPTGSGKSKIIAMLAKDFLDREKRVVLYLNRNLLLDQSAKNFTVDGMDYGVRAAGHEDQRWKPMQVSSIHTEIRRLEDPTKNRGWELHDADLVVVEEAHDQTGPETRKVLAHHTSKGALTVGISATPIDVGQLYDRLVLGCTMKEGRDCGALVYADVFGPDEPDMAILEKSKNKPSLGEELSEPQRRKLMMNPTIHGRVWDWWNILNPDRRSTLGFAPGCGESLDFAKDFYSRGVKSAHIDGKFTWVNGEMYVGDTNARDQVIRDHERGYITAIWNRFVLRTGIDLKWVEHMILATAFGSLGPFLQTIGRGMRASPRTGKKRLCIQDHGGSWWKFGSPNVDRNWELEYTSSIVAGLRQEFLRDYPYKAPVRCPQCAQIISGRECPCGFVPKNNLYPRPVAQTNGSLKMMSETLYRKRSIATAPSDKERWIKTYWRASKAKNWDANFREVMGLFQRESGYYDEMAGRFINTWLYPDKSWPLMPVEPVDFFRKVKSVPQERLRR